MKPVAFFIALALLTVVVWRVTYRPANPNDVFLGYVEGDILYI
ncbi:MAG: HlyD family secretion protein, partial [Alphaproteobacteria bacterium]|nr:HlyD family secretion protein [Alphaproteobacteria bacterium]